MIRCNSDRFEKQETILRELTIDGNATRACKVADISYTTYLNWRHDDSYFNAECTTSIAAGRGW